jgi:hypothetical protein
MDIGCSSESFAPVLLASFCTVVPPVVSSIQDLVLFLWFGLQMQILIISKDGFSVQQLG